MPKEVKNTDEVKDILVNAGVLQELFGVGDRMVRKLADQGIIEKTSHGKYLLMKSVKSYILTLKVQKMGQRISLDDEEDLDLDTERASHERLKKQITEIKLQLIKGQVHKAEDVERVMTDMFAKFRSKLDAMPSKLAKKLEGKSRTDIQKVLRKEIDNALIELASYNPTDFYSDEHIEISDEDALNLLGADEE